MSEENKTDDPGQRARPTRQAPLCAVTPTPPPHLWAASIWWATLQEMATMAFDWLRPPRHANGRGTGERHEESPGTRREGSSA